ncbi:hypothetical protein OEZ85_004718 [Tetradesmus obliquus]|uniref:TLC domain-containing protein n=1 Tax=Tetradesmus obliquus TaxID=3088 RepID=A0ABY8US69_TETOB|nr:hypothetical protein OEZ85_004718 [Tetradesmus obliquus]
MVQVLSWSQLWLTGGLVVFFPALRLVLNAAAFEPLANAVLQHSRNHGSSSSSSSSKLAPKHTQLAVEKFCESCWKLLGHVVFLCIGLAAVWGAPWLQDSRQFWDGWPHHDLSAPLHVLYQLKLGFYCSSIATYVLWDVRRSDFAATFTHHVATALLLGMSLHHKYWRVGSVIMLLNDADDTLMETAKLAKYCRREGLATTLFIAFAAAFLLLRLGYFPFFVLRSTLFEAPEVLLQPPPQYASFNGLLLLLLGLNCYWFRLVLRIAWLKLMTGSAHDVREEEDYQGCTG